MTGRSLATYGWTALVWVGLAASPLWVQAAKVSSASASRPGAAKLSEPKWHVLETANFRLLQYGTAPVAASAGETCESLRTTLRAQWAADLPAAAWTPKCDVVLHPNDASYFKEVGPGAVSTLASSLVDQQLGRIRTRRIDVRSSDSDWLSAALPHELTHVVLADRFAGRQLPRWIDEGAAILADPADKRTRHKQDMCGALANRTAFRVVELLTLEDYPAAHRWGTFYGQSASVVEYLVEQKTPAEFLQFVDLALEQGYETSLRQVYGISGISQLEQDWQAHARRPEARGTQSTAAAPSDSRRVSADSDAADRLAATGR